MVTAELAMALPVIVLAAVALAWLIALAAGQGLVVQAAREGARAAARGEPVSAVRTTARAVVSDATVTVERGSDAVVVRVTAHRSPPIAVLHSLGVDLTASATAWRES